jgi:hypothetical protein
MADRIDFRLSRVNDAWWLLFATGCYFVVHWLQHHGIGHTVIRFYVKDLIFMPCLLITVKFSAGMLGRGIHFTRHQVFGAWLYVSVVFEGFLPLISENYHADHYDIAAYALGSGLYLCMNQQDHFSVKENPSNRSLSRLS